jgi:hypothetical protein
MADTPVKLVVDCAPPTPDQDTQDLLATLTTAVQAGDAEAAAAAAAELNAALADQPSGEEYVPLDDDELADLADREAAALDLARDAAAENVKAALATTDQWAARAVEEGSPMPKDRVAYRQQLRGLFTAIAAAPDVATLDELEIPAPPAPIK